MAAASEHPAVDAFLADVQGAGLDLFKKEQLAGESFEADIVNKYGRTLYDIFFKPYTEKFLFYSPADLHRDWARAGVNRAVIDKRQETDGLWSLLKNIGDPLAQAARLVGVVPGLPLVAALPPWVVLSGGGRSPDRSAGHLPGRDDLRRQRRSLLTGFEADAVGGELVQTGQPELTVFISICEPVDVEGSERLRGSPPMPHST